MTTPATTDNAMTGELLAAVRDQAAVIRDQAATLDTPAPTGPLLAGTFALYPTPDGGVHAVFVVEVGPRGREEQRMTVTPRILRLIESAVAGKGTAGKLLRTLGVGRS